jgi:spore germination protein KA
LKREWKWLKKKHNQLLQQKITSSLSLPTNKENDRDLYIDVEKNLTVLKEIYQKCYDVVFREFWIGGEIKAYLIYIEGLSDDDECNENVLTPLMNAKLGKDKNLEEIVQKNLSVSEINTITTINDVIDSISLGKPVLLFDNQTAGVDLGLQKWQQRSIDEPQAERVIRGPREGFIETFEVNTSLLRRRIRSPQLKIETKAIGSITKTSVGTCYIEGIVDQDLVKEVNSRLARINIDGILDSGYIEELIEDSPYSPFPQVMYTEKPDVAVAHLLEGKVILVVNNSPTVLIMPITIFSMFQSAEDYYERYMIGTLIRWLRYFFIIIALLFPSLYVAILAYHQEMVPTSLMLSIAASREIVPFPALVEALLMEIMFEILREGGLRLPNQVGSAISIVGGLIIGEAAVQAGIVSTPVVIVVAVTGIASFAVPNYNASISLRMLRFPLIILAGSLGLVGIMLGVIAIVIHLCSLRSFGVPYLSPFAPSKQPDLKNDVLMRAPLWKMNTRPRLTGHQNKHRQDQNQKPGPMH